MKKIFLLITAGFALAGGGGGLVAAAEKSETKQEAHSFKTKVSKEVGYNYLLFLPEGYSKEGNKKWPVIIFLHGAGERGTNLSLVTVHGPPKIVKSRPDFPFVVVSPQCPTGKLWDVDGVLALKDEVLKKYNVDKGRVYLTGLSMGGYGTWKTAVADPFSFAAIAPICGGGEPIDVWLAGPREAARLKQLPVWAFHGGKDPVVNIQESERMVNAFKRVGNTEAKLTVYPEAGHDSWTEAYNTQEIFDWFLKHKLGGSGAK